MSKHILLDHISEIDDAYILVYNEKGIVSTGLTKSLEKSLGISFSDWLKNESDLLKKQDGVTLIDLWQNKKKVKIAWVPAQSDYLKVQQSLTDAMRLLSDKAGSVGIDGVGVAKATALSGQDQVFRIVEATDLALYRFEQYKNKKSPFTLKKIHLYGFTAKDDEIAKEKALVVSQAVQKTRDFVNTPAMDVTPETFVKKAKEIVKENPALSLEVLDVKAMKKLKMNALLAVGQGSVIPSSCLVLTYKGKPKSKKVAGWIGKGVTFDSGGLDIKPADGMLTMKCDMSGAAAVLFATEAVAKLEVPMNLVTVIPCVENMPSGSAFKPGDILTAMNGKTIEVGNTDAEGRLILADALVLAAQKGVTHFIDIATLTGACVVALGEVASGLCSNNDKFAQELISIGAGEGEKMWQMPLFEEYRKLINSDVADIQNIGGRWAGMITAALFLKEFVPENSPWCHLDIAGTAFRSSPLGISPKGASGEPVRTLISWAQKTEQ